LGATGLDGIENGVGVIAFVGQDVAWLGTVDEGQGLGAVVDLAGR
jgi:hypothetical protein